VTYTGTGGTLPAYSPTTGTLLPPIPLTGGAKAPVAGVISSDNSTIYVGTSGDNQVHLIGRKALIDDGTQTITPNLPAFIPAPNGPIGTGTDDPKNFVTPNLLVQHARKATS
jgi:hypothetical protein